MTTITIKNGQKLARTEFENWEDFQIELIAMQENFDLTSEHVKILKSREKIADKNPQSGFSWEEVKSKLKRNV
jgi:sulfur relay (sulfurtransferase) DsrC/TusE family protein